MLYYEVLDSFKTILKKYCRSKYVPFDNQTKLNRFFKLVQGLAMLVETL